jgi:hypothetical protein
MLMPRSCYQMQHALPERIGAKQKRLPREAAFVSATTGETTVNHQPIGRVPALAGLPGAALLEPARLGQLAQALNPQTTSPTAAALSKASAQAEQLRATAQRLIKRMAPVMLPATAESGPAAGQGIGNQARSSAPLVSQIETLAHSIELVHAELLLLEQRLAV